MGKLIQFPGLGSKSTSQKQAETYGETKIVELRGTLDNVAERQHQLMEKLQNTERQIKDLRAMYPSVVSMPTVIAREYARLAEQAERELRDLTRAIYHRGSRQ